jgi:ATP-dependent Lon protease
MRKVAREIASKPADKVRKPVRVRAASLTRYLGVPKFTKRRLEQRNWVGVAAGLAWTGGGGDLLMIEATTIPGRGKLILTGMLGDVMQESAQAALTYARSRAELLLLDREFYQKLDIHIHVPEGAIPKDGPSAGITMATALISALTGLTVRRDLAMTGEITLRGNVLPIGGLSEKLVAAHQAGYTVVLLPEENRKDASEIPSEVRRGLAIRFVESMDQVLDFALVGERRGEMPFFNAARPEILPEPAIAPPAAAPVLEPQPPTSTTADKPGETPSGPGEREPGYAH